MYMYTHFTCICIFAYIYPCIYFHIYIYTYIHKHRDLRPHVVSTASAGQVRRAHEHWKSGGGQGAGGEGRLRGAGGAWPQPAGLVGSNTGGLLGALVLPMVQRMFVVGVCGGGAKERTGGCVGVCGCVGEWVCVWVCMWGGCLGRWCC